ncbi:MAG: alpha/beta hydrolase [Streptomyces sp.]|uniref:alpha/beta hydrolase n=1 Tax=Streptomyces sp. TaxID=1931 RepID=UPI003D6A7512
MARTVVFLHGAWMTSACWEPFQGYFEERGFTTLAPAWPGKDRGVEAVRADSGPLAGLGGQEIIDHYAEIIRSQSEPPILIGHSFGGLFVQVLLSRGLGAAGVAIDSAPPKGIIATQPTAFRALGSIIANPANRSRVVHWTFEQFRYAFVHTLPQDQARAAYEQFVTPETGRIFFQGALSGVDRRSPFVVDFAKPDRTPLLMIAGEQDRIVPAALNRANHRRYRAEAPPVDFVEFPGRTHWIIAQDGWREVAAHVADWIDSRLPAPPAR